HAIESRNPLRRQVREITRTEEQLTALEQSLFMLMPPEAFAGAKDLRQLLLVFHARSDHVIKARQMHARIVLRQSKGLLGRHEIGSRGRVVLHIVRSSIGIEPLLYVPFSRPGAPREFGRRHRTAIAHGAVKTEPVSDDDERRV